MATWVWFFHILAPHVLNETSMGLINEKTSMVFSLVGLGASLP